MEANDIVSVRIPPQSQEAEQATLGAMLLERDAIGKALDLLAPADLYRPIHRTIFEGISDLYSRQQPVDLITLGEWLQQHEQLAQIGGMFYLQTLMSQVPTAAGISHYCGIVRAKAIQRDLIHAAHAITEAAYAGELGMDALLDMSEKRLLTISERAIAADEPQYLNQYMKRIFSEQDAMIETGTRRGLKFGFEGIDRMIRDLMPGNVVIIGARPKMGKTALMSSIALNLSLVASEPVLGLVFSMEMEGEELSLRAMLTKMTYGEEYLDDPALCVANPEVMEQMSDAINGLWNSRLLIDSRPALTIAEIDRTIRRVTAKHGRPGYVMVDYLQLAEPAQHGSRNEEVGGVAYGLKSLAKRHKTRVIALSQLTRSVEDEHPSRPRARQFLESGRIEACADLLAYLYWPAKYGPNEMRAIGLVPDTWHDNVVEFGILMARRGASGNTRGYLIHKPGHYSYRDLTREEESDLRRRLK